MPVVSNTVQLGEQAISCFHSPFWNLLPLRNRNGDQHERDQNIIFSQQKQDWTSCLHMYLPELANNIDFNLLSQNTDLECMCQGDRDSDSTFPILLVAWLYTLSAGKWMPRNDL